MAKGWVYLLRGVRATTLAVCFVAASFGLTSTSSAANCTFVLGFKTLHDLMPTTVSDCLVDEHHNPTNGDGLQETAGPTGAGGLLVWRKADNWTAFTDGYRTWINGPFGLQERLNTGPLYSWEAGGTVAPAATPTPSPATQSGVTFTAVTGGAPGGVASASVHTSANASWSIDYWTLHGTHSVAQGLYPKAADSNGNVSWAWNIGGNTYAGNGTVTVTCGAASATAGIVIG